LIRGRLNAAKARIKNVFVNLERKLEAQRRSGTVVVPTANFVDLGLDSVAMKTFLEPIEKLELLDFGGSMVARLKL
jgi:hypothetical protein